MAIPKHVIGNWRTKPNYLNEFKYVPPGKRPDAGTLNSCNEPKQPHGPATKQCSGRGYCKDFGSTSGVAAQLSQKPPLAFCQCERDWADPECGTKRKSQRTAFFWSLCFGWIGADYFYLGYWLWGLGKLVTLGGCGFWWLIDVVRTGAGPVYAYNFRTANDLPHWVAVLCMVFVCMVVGFFVAIQLHLHNRRNQRKDVFLHNSKEEARQWEKTEHEMKNWEGPCRQLPNRRSSFEGRPGFSGYGATLPAPLCPARPPPTTARPPASNYAEAGRPPPTYATTGPRVNGQGVFPNPWLGPIGESPLPVHGAVASTVINDPAVEFINAVDAS